MSNISDIAKFAAGDSRYGITVLSGFVLGLLLLFLKELKEISAFVPLYVIPGLIIFTIGTAIIGHIQILLTVSANTKAVAADKQPSGIKESHLTRILWAHAIWFILFLCYLAWRALA